MREFITCFRDTLLAQRLQEEKRPPFRVPQLGIRVDGHLELFEESCFKDIEWRLADCDAALSDVEFPTQEAAGEAGEVDVSEAGRVEIRFIDQLHEQLTLLNAEPGWDVASLVNWLDRAIPHPDITQAQAAVFIHNLVMGLMVGRGLTVEQLARQKFRLRDAIEATITSTGTYRRRAFTTVSCLGLAKTASR